MVKLHFLLKFSKNINIQTSTSRKYWWNAYILYHWKYVYGKIFPDKEHYPSKPNIFIAYLPSREGNDICHIALSMSSSHFSYLNWKNNILTFSFLCNNDNTVALFSASKRVTRNPQVSLVSRAWDLWPGDVHETEGAQGDVRRQDHEEQDDQLRAQVRH